MDCVNFVGKKKRIGIIFVISVLFLKFISVRILSMPKYIA